MKLEWINSGGGPLVCASLSAARIWQGTQSSSLGSVANDYMRACNQLDYVSTIMCGSEQVIVLGDEPLQSAFVVKSDCVLIVRWVSCASHELAVSAIERLPLVLPIVEEPTEFRLDTEGLIMFDAAIASVDIDRCSKVKLSPGVFRVTTEEYKSERTYKFIVHRFIRIMTAS